MPPNDVRVRRVYDEPTAEDGRRVLVDRLWPRGLSHDDAHLDQWCKDVAPSNELRRWYGHDPARFESFTDRYLLELQSAKQAVALTDLRDAAERGPLTLLTATRDLATSHARVLSDLLDGN